MTQTEIKLFKGPGYWHYKLKDPIIFKVKDPKTGKPVGKDIETGSSRFRWKIFRRPVFAIWAIPIGAKFTYHGQEMLPQGLRFPVEYWTKEDSIKKWIRSHPEIKWELAQRHKKALEEAWGSEKAKEIIAQNPKKDLARNLFGGAGIGFVTTEITEKAMRSYIEKKSPDIFVTGVDYLTMPVLKPQDPRIISVPTSIFALGMVTLANTIPTNKVWTVAGGLISILKNIIVGK